MLKPKIAVFDSIDNPLIAEVDVLRTGRLEGIQSLVTRVGRVCEHQYRESLWMTCFRQNVIYPYSRLATRRQVDEFRLRS